MQRSQGSHTAPKKSVKKITTRIVASTRPTAVLTSTPTRIIIPMAVRGATHSLSIDHEIAKLFALVQGQSSPLPEPLTAYRA